MTTKTRKKPKIADVAKLARTSEAAVSVVLNNRVGESVRVSEETQARIWEAVRQLGYAANPIAKSLAGGRNRIIGVFTFEATFPIEARDFYYPFLIGVEAEAAEQDHDLLLFASATAPDGKRSIYRDGINRLQLADGAILLGRDPDRTQMRALAADNFPFVFIGRRQTPEDNISYAAANYAEATAQITQHMIEHEHRQMAYFRTTLDVESSNDREAGYRQALQQAGLSASAQRVWRGPANELSYTLVRHYLDQGVTAFLAENDEFGKTLLLLAEQLGLRCPNDFSLAVLGDSLTPGSVPPDWTTFKIPRVEMGREAVRLLFKMLNDDAAELPLRVTLPCTFIAGSTVARPKQRG